MNGSWFIENRLMMAQYDASEVPQTDDPVDVAYNARMKAWNDRWSSLMGLDNWDIEYIINGSLESHAAGSCLVKRKHGNAATIRYPYYTVFNNDKAAEETVVHEHLHVVWDPVYRYLEEVLMDTESDTYKYMEGLIEESHALTSLFLLSLSNSLDSQIAKVGEVSGQLEEANKTIKKLERENRKLAKEIAGE